MAVITISARDFARDMAAAKRAAAQGPVFITDRGVPRYVLQTVQSYYHATTGKAEPSLLEAMHALPAASDDFEPPRLPVQFSPTSFD
ncbi:Uncharacterised protein [Bordetella ansorpii]|uniref:Phd_YefM n=1 Tax=Bordetella ansorpii TaxID=288768 RepID=A0A157QNN5_9BORD|nr:hypothetical protein [Bordetella ansorpii]SAI47176.1 Uncharacterised protein [Bordetella ansorpii]